MKQSECGLQSKIMLEEVQGKGTVSKEQQLTIVNNSTIRKQKRGHQPDDGMDQALKQMLDLCAVKRELEMKKHELEMKSLDRQSNQCAVKHELEMKRLDRQLKMTIASHNFEMFKPRKEAKTVDSTLTDDDLDQMFPLHRNHSR